MLPPANLVSLIAMNRPAHFYKYCTAKVAKINLRTKRLRLSSPILFNDPFDCYFAPCFGNLQRSVTKYENRLHAILTGKEILPPESSAAFSLAPLIHLSGTVPPEVIARSRESSKARLLSVAKNANDQWQLLWKNDVPRFRVLCLCEEGNNPLLWSHYADSHRGVAFEFDASPEAGMPFQKAEPVKYRRRPPRIYSQQDLIESALDLKPLPEDEETSRPLVMTKAMEWSYEKEWRVVMMSVEDRQSHFEDWQFSPRSLSKIFLGCRISPRNREAIKRLATGDFAHVEIHEALKTSARFGLGFKRIR